MIDLRKRPNLQVGIFEQDYIESAKQLQCEVAAIKAVSLIESGKSGFLPSGRPKILFEGHYFYRILRQYGKAELIAKQYPSVCYYKWTTKHYLGNEREYDRLLAALDACKKHGIPESAAFRSASWGKYQIMGDNYQKAGFDTVYSMVESCFQSEKNHLKMFCAYLQNTFLDDELRALDFAKFAYGYNGAGYKRNQYDTKMLAAYKKFKAEESNVPTQPVPVEIIEINTPISIPDNISTSSVTLPVENSKPTGMEAHEPAIQIGIIDTVVNKFKHAKELVLTALGAIGLSGTSMAALYEKITSNQMLEYVLVGVAIVTILIAGILLVTYFIKHLDFLHSIDLEKAKTEREINLEQLRIRANPQLYNVEINRNV